LKATFNKAQNMFIKNINAYIHFNGTAEKAIELYKSALGAKTEVMMRYSDMPGSTPSPGQENLVMHSELRIGQGTLMVSDAPPQRPVASEGNTQVALDFADPTAMAQAFEALAAGGTVTLPIHDAFWGAKFGMLTDAYGARWLLNCQVDQAGNSGGKNGAK
jgi:PhnB protein